MRFMGGAMLAGIAGVAWHGLLDLCYYQFLPIWVFLALAGAYVDVAGRAKARAAVPEDETPVPQAPALLG
jgi:hypothetical protein